MKEYAPSNILLIYITSLDTFHLLSGWLKEVASRNIYHIFVTLDTFQLSSGWLKDVALVVRIGRRVRFGMTGSTFGLVIWRFAISAALRSGKSQNRNDCLDFFLSVARLRLGFGSSKG